VLGDILECRFNGVIKLYEIMYFIVGLGVGNIDIFDTLISN
jgi:hypothetical protein